jgi:hypothetical protein
VGAEPPPLFELRRVRKAGKGRAIASDGGFCCLLESSSILKSRDFCGLDPLFAGAAIKEYAGKIKKTADGRWRSISSQAGRTQKIEPERCIKTDG